MKTKEKNVTFSDLVELDDFGHDDLGKKTKLTKVNKKVNKNNLRCIFRASLLQVVELDYLRHDEAILEVTVNATGGLRSLGAFLKTKQI
jgi:hypothetical protein